MSEEYTTSIDGTGEDSARGSNIARRNRTNGNTDVEDSSAPVFEEFDKEEKRKDEEEERKERKMQKAEGKIGRLPRFKGKNKASGRNLGTGKMKPKKSTKKTEANSHGKAIELIVQVVFHVSILVAFVVSIRFWDFFDRFLPIEEEGFWVFYCTSLSHVCKLFVVGILLFECLSHSSEQGDQKTLWISEFFTKQSPDFIQNLIFLCGYSLGLIFVICCLVFFVVSAFKGSYEVEVTGVCVSWAKLFTSMIKNYSSMKQKYAKFTRGE